MSCRATLARKLEVELNQAKCKPELPPSTPACRTRTLNTELGVLELYSVKVWGFNSLQTQPNTTTTIVTCHRKSLRNSLSARVSFNPDFNWKHVQLLGVKSCLRSQQSCRSEILGFKVNIFNWRLFSIDFYCSTVVFMA